MAVFKALSEGEREIVAVAVVADTPTPTAPCGACRQVLWECCGDVPIVLANLTSAMARYQLADLLPVPFDRNALHPRSS